MPVMRDPEGLEIQYLKQFVDFKDAKVLEIGCGTGFLTEQYVDSARFVVGLDVDVKALRTAQDIEAAHFVNVSAGELPFGDANFDVAIFSSSL